ncbi:MAG: lipid A export permease/ATP-binding protein MsbA [Pseudomonadota bacterium]
MPGRSSDRRGSLRIYWRLMGYVRPYIPVFLLSVFGLWLFGAMEIAFIDVFGYLVDVLTRVTGEAVDTGGLGMQVSDSGITARIARHLVGDDDPLAQARLVLPAMLVGIAVVRGFGFLLGNYGMSYVAQSVVHRLRTQVFDKYTRMPAAYFDGNMSGHLVAQLTYHVFQVMGATTSALKVIIREGFLTAVLLAYLLWLNWRLALIFLTLMPVVAAIIGAVSARFRRLGKKIQAAMGNVTQIAGEVVSGQREMHLYGGGDYERGRLVQASEANRRQSLKLELTEGLSTPVVQLMLAAIMGLLMWLVLTPTMLADMTVGGFIKFLFAAAMLAKPVRQLTQVNAVVQRGIAAADTLFQTLDAEEEHDSGTLEVARVAGAVEFDRVGFAYREGAPQVLTDICFRVAPGETIALVGSSGSGKTTLVSLIPRFYSYQQGRILLDGRELKEYRLAALRRQIAFVSQHVVLFNDSVYNNIAYGELASRSAAEVRDAARRARALEFIEALPQGFDTPIGDDGVLLSGGQRQRLAIARALLKDAPVLILDEATSALDSESERHIQAALEVAMRGRTTFVIAHRLSTVEQADRILVLEAGRIVEEGDHARLLAAGGRYASLYRQQFEPLARAAS